MTFLLLATYILVSFGFALMVRGSKSLLIRTPSNRTISLLLLVPPVFLCAFLLVGLRPESAGGDTPAYLYAYQRMGSILDARELGQRYFGNTEMLWWPVQSVFHGHLSGQQWLALNFVAAFLLTLAAYAAMARHHSINPIIFCLAFLTFYAVYTGNVMRQTIAIPLVAAAFSLYFDRRYVAWLALTAIAVGFHWSAIVGLCVPIFGLRIFRRDWPYLVFPVAALTFSMVGTKVLGVALGLLGIDVLSGKFELYSSGVRESHLANVWQTANFWLCLIAYVAFVVVVKPSQSRRSDLHSYALLNVVIVLLTVSMVDLSERYLPFLLFVLPIMLALVVERLRIPPAVGNAIFLCLFFLMGLAVYFNPSAQATLGYSA